MDKSIPLFFAGVISAIIASLILASHNGDIFQNLETLVLGLAGAITKIWMIFFAFSLIIIFPVIGIESVKKRIKPILFLPISFTLGHATVIVLLSVIKFSIDVIT